MRLDIFSGSGLRLGVLFSGCLLLESLLSLLLWLCGGGGERLWRLYEGWDGR